MSTFPDQRSNEVFYFKPPLRGQPLTSEQVSLLSDYVSLNAEALAKATEAVQLPRSRFPVDFSPGFNTPLPHLANLKGLARSAGFHALLALQTKETEAAALIVTNVAENSISEAKRRHFFISHMLIVSLSRITVREAEELAEMRIARAALAVERFRLSNDRLPKGLQELVPRFLTAVPLDPFDGTSLRYKPLRKGYVIYSIGLDGRDDSGKEPPVRRRGSERVPEDITFAVER